MSDSLDSFTREQLQEEVVRLRKEALQHLSTEQRLQGLNDALTQRTYEAEQRTAQLRLLAAQFTQIENRERRRLALLLHDHLQQLLVGSRMKLGLLKQQVKNLPVSTSVAEAAEMIDEAIAVSRSLSVELSPPILYEAGLSAGLDWLAEQMEIKHNLHVKVEVDDEPDDKDVRIFLFQCVRELLFNVVKHSKTLEAVVEVRRLNDDLIQVTVSDEGVGFDPSMLSKLWAMGESFGLHSIRERLSLLGGAMEIVSQPGRGTKAVLVAPLHGTHIGSNGPA